ncbi:MAG: bifunctional (p)ppGpp synthetase/guanosine-3',5'-bis(diphosphate) 3'-pyrophosphohydrolase [Bacteroidales bacterium]|nr:bifunctional (p)ppGpp synthetase/guanosine-3',5'-bis(diphosphate) 3'-pyrophosphohydrolase [Bacteroidales bacterium]
MAAGKNEIRSDKRMLNQYRGLLRICKPDMSEAEFGMLKKAMNLALDACRDKPVKLGDHTIFHALGVARIIAGEIGLGATSVISSLLFDFYLDDSLSREDLEPHLDSRIIQIIDGVAKISRIDTHKSTDQGENLRNLLLTLSSDIRVILVKLADRIYYMRNLEHLDRAEQLTISTETFHIYSPLAHRMGLYNIKSELEDLHLKYTDIKSYSEIVEKLQETKVSRDKFITGFIAPLQKQLEEERFDFEIKARTKSVYSIWSKMKQQQVDFEEVYDLFAIRIILRSDIKLEKSDCWKVYSLVTDHYQPNPNRLRDWISVPKSNGYESLHTTVVVPGGKWVEVQIRTERMNEVAEKGLAAHWKYKGASDQSDTEEWLNRIREMLENPEPDAGDIIDDFKLSIYNKEIFVFTPKGDLKKFPAGATVLDFAFDVHSQVGMTCMGAKINGRSVPIRHKLSNGDKVEIITSKGQRPKQDWLQYVVSSKAKSKIKQALQETKLAEAEEGREILRRRFRNWKLEFEDVNINKLLRHYRLKTATDLYHLVAIEKIDLLKIKDILQDKDKPPVTGKSTEIGAHDVEKLMSSGLKQDDYLIIDKSLDKLDYRLGKCCNPIYGDEIFGFVTVSAGITIHRVNCPNAAQLISRHGYRVVKAQWAVTGADIYLPATIRVTGLDDIGILSKISDVISKDLRVNMRSVSIDSTEGMFEGTITLFVKDTRHLDVLIKNLARLKGVLSVSRMEL